MRPLVIDAAGDDLAIGRTHAAGSMGMRSAVADFVAVTRAAYPASDPSVRRRVDEVRAAWQELTPGTLRSSPAWPRSTSCRPRIC